MDTSLWLEIHHEGVLTCSNQGLEQKRGACPTKHLIRVLFPVHAIKTGSGQRVDLIPQVALAWRTTIKRYDPTRLYCCR